MVGLRGVADEPHFLRSGEEAALGLLDDEDGLAVCADAVRDAQRPDCCWPRHEAWRPDPDRWRSSATTTTSRRSIAETGVISWCSRGRGTPRPDVDLMVALDESGFNHVAAPLVRWTWEGVDLGVVQEPLADRSRAGRWP